MKTVAELRNIIRKFVMDERGNMVRQSDDETQPDREREPLTVQTIRVEENYRLTNNSKAEYIDIEEMEQIADRCIQFEYT